MAEGVFTDRPILQFGTSRFLQAHVDLFAHEARRVGQDVPPVVVVQSSGSADRAPRLAALAAPEGYPVIVRGMKGGAPLEYRVAVRSVRRAISTATDWAEVVDIFAHHAGWVVSNTADAGYQTGPAEAADLTCATPAASFPAKLAQLFYARYRALGAPMTVLPCELVNENGDVLRAIVRKVAENSGAERGFFDWFEQRVTFANTLVDRIVSEALSPAGAVAEPYALWAIEQTPALELPFHHPAVQLVENLNTPERLKLHILNLGHSYLAELWRQGQRPATETVLDILTDPVIKARLETLYDTEVIPGFAAKGMEADARAYVQITMGRFLNPYLEHRVADIATNHAVKVERRIAAFLDWAKPSAPTLRAIVAQYQSQPQESAS